MNENMTKGVISVALAAAGVYWRELMIPIAVLALVMAAGAAPC